MPKVMKVARLNGDILNGNLINGHGDSPIDGERDLLKVASRKSELALIQTNHVIETLKEVHPRINFEIVTMSTKGDQILDRPLPQIGGKSLFTAELEEALLAKKVDFAVHSLKDLPTTLPPGLAIGAVLQREDPRDALLLHSKHRGSTLGSLPDNSVIGTSSLRRAAQLRRQYPNLVVKDVRGNLQTRLKKLDQGHFDGIILAVAGVHRMGWQQRISQILEENCMLYAVGQGALAVECRSEDCELFSGVGHQETALATLAERSLLCSLEAGCSAPIAVSSHYEDNGSTLRLTAAVWSLDGATTLQQSMAISLDKYTNGNNNTLAEEIKSSDLQSRKLYCGLSDCGLDAVRVKAAFRLGKNLASELLRDGAMDIILAAKEATEKQAQLSRKINDNSPTVGVHAWSLAADKSDLKRKAVEPIS